MKLLEGIRVLDLTNVLSGPFCTLQLALLGAEVIKIENPKDGDLARKLGCVPDFNKKLMGTSYLAQNANKKSLTLNLKTPRGLDGTHDRRERVGSRTSGCRAIPGEGRPRAARRSPARA